MSRSVKKGPFVEARLIKRIQDMNTSGKKSVVKTWSRSSTIFPDMVGVFHLQLQQNLYPVLQLLLIQ